MSGIPNAGLRRDARALIIQFAGADREVEIDVRRSISDRVAIRGAGDACDRFVQSFLESEMREFQGLRYQSE